MRKRIRNYILICLLFIPFITANCSEYLFKIEFPEFGENLDPFVSIIDGSGNNIIIGNPGGAKSHINSNNVSIIKKDDFGEYSYNIKLGDNIENECQLWLRNNFQDDDFNSGEKLFNTEVTIFKDRTKIGTITLSSRSGKKLLTSTIKGVKNQSFEIPNNDSGLWKLCSIIPKYDKILIINDFYDRSKIVSGKVWNTKTKKPVVNAKIVKNGKIVAKTDKTGAYFFTYAFKEKRLEIFAKYKNCKSNIITFKTVDEFPRTANLSLAYQPAPPPPENFRKKLYFHFTFDSDILQNNSFNRDIIQKIQNTINSYKIEGKVTIEGHTDNIGSSNYNYDLSFRRATAVRDMIQKMGTDNMSFEILGFGEDNPITDNSTKSGRKQNRRVEIVFKYIEYNN
ncbi:MAG: OmpA family protein [Candidatus Marinimicrobia bacterium]|nr:OmpA family protein [Candidatus Neomarinimicrobiota bacterium]